MYGGAAPLSCDTAHRSGFSFVPPTTRLNPPFRWIGAVAGAQPRMSLHCKDDEQPTGKLAGAVAQIQDPVCV
ncbi:MAG: hypothetical protein AzoDbin1_04934 [Azoarcus sp.]|nr:hypothetical protein [Azoarcus sp.]